MGKGATEISLSKEALKTLRVLRNNHFSGNIQFSGTGSLLLIKIIISEMIVQIIQEQLVIHFWHFSAVRCSPKQTTHLY